MKKNKNIINRYSAFTSVQTEAIASRFKVYCSHCRAENFGWGKKCHRCQRDLF